jgi:hypothetical protein
MNHLETLAVDSEIAVYVMASPDAQEIEILPLKPCMASDGECESLASRWSGRGLQGAGVLGRSRSIRHNKFATRLKRAGLHVGPRSTRVTETCVIAPKDARECVRVVRSCGSERGKRGVAALNQRGKQAPFGRMRCASTVALTRVSRTPATGELFIQGQ